MVKIRIIYKTTERKTKFTENYIVSQRKTSKKLRQF